jgi:hypothetical protein
VRRQANNNRLSLPYGYRFNQNQPAATKRSKIGGLPAAKNRPRGFAVTRNQGRRPAIVILQTSQI